MHTYITTQSVICSLKYHAMSAVGLCIFFMLDLLDQKKKNHNHQTIGTKMLTFLRC